MRTHWLVVAAIVLLLPTSARAQLSLAEAKSAALADLAARVLGDAGTLMLDVDRPQGERLDRLHFYSRAIAWGSYYPVCASDWVTVEFDKEGRVSALHSERRFGVEGDLYREDWTYAQFSSLCASVQSTRQYFPAPDHAAASAIALYLDAIGRSGPFAAQHYKFSCSGACMERESEVAWLSLSKITSAKEIECASIGVKRPQCFEIESRSGLASRVFRLYGSNYQGRTVITRIAVTATIAQP